MYFLLSAVPEDMSPQWSKSKRMRKAKRELVKTLSENGHSSITNTTLWAASRTTNWNQSSSWSNIHHIDIYWYRGSRWNKFHLKERQVSPALDQIKKTSYAKLILHLKIWACKTFSVYLIFNFDLILIVLCIKIIYIINSILHAEFI